MKTARTCLAALAWLVVGCNSPTSGGWGGGGGGGPSACTRNADCPLKYACTSGFCAAVTLDKAAPKIVSCTPPNAGEYSVKEIPTITFNEPIRLGTDGVRLYDTLNGRYVAIDASLSADEKTVTIVPLELVAPANVEVRLTSQCTDNWGNACTGFASWRFPVWLMYSGSVPSLDVGAITSAVDATGAEYLSWITYESTCGGDLHVYRSNGSSSISEWPDDAGRLPFDAGRIAKSPSLAAHGDTVAISFVEVWGCSDVALRVAKRVSAGSWALVGDAARFAQSWSIWFPSLALDSAGNPVVAWQENGQIHVARSDGTSWSDLGGAVGDPSLDNRSPSLAFGPGDVPCVAFVQHEVVDRLDKYSVHAHCWDDTSSMWAPLGGGTVTPALYSSVSVSERGMAFDAGGVPFVGWARYGSRYPEVARLDGGGWIVETIGAIDYAAPQLVLDPTLGVVAGLWGWTGVLAAVHGTGGWVLLPEITSQPAVPRATFATSQETGPWAAWYVKGSTATYTRAARYNQ